jgi:hypothetical protein
MPQAKSAILLHVPLTHPVVLVCGDRGELCLLECKGLELLSGRRRVLVPRVVDHVQAGLVPVHRVQYHLQETNALCFVTGFFKRIYSLE